MEFWFNTSEDRDVFADLVMNGPTYLNGDPMPAEVLYRRFISSELLDC